MRKSFFEIIEKQLRQDQEELAAAEEITKIVFPVIDGLNRGQILNPVILKAKLAKLDPKYRDEFYGLCRIATDGGPEGSFIVLDPAKVLSLLDEIEVEEEVKKKGGKKFILGMTKKVVNAIRNLLLVKLSVLCHLTNDLVLKKVVNVPSPDRLKSSGVKIIPLNDKSNQRSK